MAEKSTREKILAAARMFFVEHGYAGASIGKIAKQAGVNHSLVFHHFSNKEQLWVAVKQAIVQEAKQQIKTLPDTHLTFDKFLQELFTENLKFYQNNPDIVRMLNWQRLEHSNNNLKIGITLSTETQAWIKAFKHYQLQGDINSKLKPEFILTLVLSAISSAALDPNIFIQSKKDQHNYIKFCVESLLKAFK